MTQDVECQVVAVGRVIDAATTTPIPTERAELRINEVAEVMLQTRAALVFDNYGRVPSLGRFVLADDANLLGGGIVSGALYPSQREIKSQNIFWSESEITAQVILYNADSATRSAKLTFGVSALEPQRLEILQSGHDIFQTHVQRNLSNPLTFEVTLAPGPNTLTFRTDHPGRSPVMAIREPWLSAFITLKLPTSVNTVGDASKTQRLKQ